MVMIAGVGGLKFIGGVIEGGGWRLANNNHRSWCPKVDRQTFQPLK